MHRFVEIVATNPAKMFGLWPKKGTIAVGSDGDLVLWDPEKETTLSAATHHMRVDYNPYEGRVVKGAPAVVLSRGEVIVDHGRLQGRRPAAASSSSASRAGRSWPEARACRSRRERRRRERAPPRRTAAVELVDTSPASRRAPLYNARPRPRRRSPSARWTTYNYAALWIGMAHLHPDLHAGGGPHGGGDELVAGARHDPARQH